MMVSVMAFSIAQPFWFWLVIAAILLAVEVATGTGWLLWPAASAAVVAVAALFVRLPVPEASALFAVLTIASAYLGRRFLRPPPVGDLSDVNEPTSRIVGRRGESVEAFHSGRGRVFVDGKEWAARATGEVAAGAGVEVEALDGAVLIVRAIQRP